jgi:fibronectin-binding autotransporter adhesin
MRSIRPSFHASLRLLGLALVHVLGLCPAAPAQTTVTYTNGETGSTARTTTFADPLTLTITSGSATESGAISGDGSLTKTGAGTLIYSGTPSYLGATSVDAGTLAFTGLHSFFQGTRPVFVAAGATLDTGDGGINLSVVSGTGTVTGSSNGGIFYSSAAQNLTVSLTGAMGLVTQSSTGTFSVQSDNTYTGNTDINSGNLVLLAGSSIVGTAQTYIAADGTASLTVSDGALYSSTGTFSVADNAGSHGTINLGAASTAAATGTGILDVATVAGGAGTATLQFNTTATSAAPAYFTRDGTASGTGVATSGALQLVQTAGYTVITGNLAHTGGTTLNSGTLQIGNGGTTGSLAGSVANDSALVFKRSDAFGFAGVISGTGSLAQTGTGTLALSGANTYAGGTTISAGTLLANNTAGSALGSGPVTVGSGATLGGSGFIAGLTTLGSGAILDPGSSPGTLTFTGGLTLDTGSILNFQLGTVSDLIRVSGGTLTGPIGTGGVTLNFSDSGGFTAGTYTLINYTSATLGNFESGDFIIGSSISGYTYDLALAGDTLQLTASAIPEPGTYAAIFGALALGFAAYRRRRRA